MHNPALSSQLFVFTLLLAAAGGRALGQKLLVRTHPDVCLLPIGAAGARTGGSVVIARRSRRPLGGTLARLLSGPEGSYRQPSHPSHKYTPAAAPLRAERTALPRGERVSRPLPLHIFSAARAASLSHSTAPRGSVLSP